MASIRRTSDSEGSLRSEAVATLTSQAGTSWNQNLRFGFMTTSIVPPSTSCCQCSQSTRKFSC